MISIMCGEKRTMVTMDRTLGPRAEIRYIRPMSFDYCGLLEFKVSMPTDTIIGALSANDSVEIIGDRALMHILRVNEIKGAIVHYVRVAK